MLPAIIGVFACCLGLVVGLAVQAGIECTHPFRDDSSDELAANTCRVAIALPPTSWLG